MVKDDTNQSSRLTREYVARISSRREHEQLEKLPSIEG